MFQIVIPIFNQHDAAIGWIDSWIALAKGRLSFLLIDNGSDEPFASHEHQIKCWREEADIKILRNEENIGVYPTFQQGYDITKARWIFYSHSDVEMLQPGWDTKLNGWLLDFECWGDFTHPSINVGVCGMFGAKGIGTPDIYRSPYDFRQMMRWDCWTVPSMAGAGGKPIEGNTERVMVLDGFSLIVNRKMVKEVMGGKFDHERYPVHHMYDNDICLESHYGGYRNYVLDIDCIHHGGMTSTREKWAEGFNSTDLKIHRKAHRVFYDKYRGRLPVSVQ